MTTKKYTLAALGFFVGAFAVTYAATKNGHQLFRRVLSPLRSETVLTDNKNLAQMAQTTREYLRSLGKDEQEKLYAKTCVAGQSATRIQETLGQLETLLGEKKNATLSPEDLAKHFTFMKWDGDKLTASTNGCIVPTGKIRLTQYLVFETRGSDCKTAQYPCALYAPPGDEADMSQEAIEQKKDKLIRYRYTKQDAVDGALEKHRESVKPLVWLSRNDLEEALMQGTISVTMPSGQKKVFNVDKNNGIPYVKTSQVMLSTLAWAHLLQSPTSILRLLRSTCVSACWPIPAARLPLTSTSSITSLAPSLIAKSLTNSPAACRRMLKRIFW